MKIAKSLKQYWKLSERERQTTYVSESFTSSYPIKAWKEPLVSVIALFNAHDLPLAFVPPVELKEIVKEPLLRESVANRLLKAAINLPPHLSFRISEGYRPLSYQKQIFKEIYEQMAVSLKNVSKQTVWEETTKYVSDPALCPPHTTGGALDCTLQNQKGEEVWMGNDLN